MVTWPLTLPKKWPKKFRHDFYVLSNAAYHVSLPGREAELEGAVYPLPWPGAG